MVAAAIFFAFIHPRHDVAAAAGTVRFLFKFVVAGLLAATALAALVMLSRPEPGGRGRMASLAAAPLALLAAVVARTGSCSFGGLGQPAHRLATASTACRSFPLMGIGPLALFVAALRHGAPSRPGLAGAVAGLAAGGIAATLYAAHCIDNSPLFVATWYTLAIAILTGTGALAGRAFARW